MMDRKSRSSLEDPGVAASALRRLTQTPRLSLRRPGTTVSSASSISSGSSTSHDHDDHSCVFRDAPHDDCALNRFLVWVAIKRNACPKMTDEDRRQCPLLRCRKRFPNHELMLRHIYSCEQLAAGEYWCYDCEREERFADARTCKRCLGHPSKRRKIVGMAKNFFRELGHKSRGGSLPDLDLESSVSSEDTPPSNDEFGEDEIGLWDEIATPHRPELQGNEVQIHEIDSNEVPLPTIWEEDMKGRPSMDLQSAQERSVSQVPKRKPLPTPRTITPAELETVAWNGRYEQMPTIAPRAFWGDQQARDRPALQVQTDDLVQYRSPAKRSKMLAPSSSVRSNASTESSSSMASTDSYAVSVMSNWSSIQTYDSALTTPADDFAPNPFRPCAPQPESFVDQLSFTTPDLLPGQNILADDTLDPSLLTAELPADIPMVDIIPPAEADQNASSVDTVQQSFGFDTQSSSSVPFDGSFVPNQYHSQPVQVATDTPPTSPPGSATSLVKTAWEALQLHISESMKKLRKSKENDLVKQLQSMSSQDVASAGLQTLLQILDGSMVESPVQLLCFVHLAYSFSLVVHEQDAPSRGSQLFKQAVSYASWLSRADRHAYLPVVDVLWKPTNMSRDEVQGLMRKSSSAAALRAKGKLPIRSDSEQSHDALAFVAQFFLDELEFSALQETDQGPIQASELCVQHLKDTAFDYVQEGCLTTPVDFLQDSLAREYADSPIFVSKLQGLKNKLSRGYVVTARRLELELMQVGKTYLASDVFFDRYIASVRAHVDSLPSLGFPRASSRQLYYQLGIKVVDHVLKEPSPRPNITDEVSPMADVDLDNLLGPMEPNLDNFDFSTFTNINTPLSGYETTPTAFTTDHTLSVTPQTNTDSGPATASTSPPSHGPTPAAPPASSHVDDGSSWATKVESDSCCELCGYRPEGDPRWFPGSMAKHKKLQHASTPPKIYKCPFPGCTSKYTNRPDNLRQHQIKKGHFVEGQDADDSGNRPCKRKKMS